MDLIHIFIILVVHYIADFTFQSTEEALGKSTSWRELLSHTVKYSVVWFIYILSFGVSEIFYKGESTLGIGIVFFILITFLAHTTTDYISSRESKKFFDKKEYKGGWAVVGIDQIAHYVQLLLCYKYFLL